MISGDLIAVFGLAVSAVGLMIALVALRLSFEQARAYLIPFPTMYIDTQRGLVLRNLGPGAMINFVGVLSLATPGANLPAVQRTYPGLSTGELVVLLDKEFVLNHAIIEIELNLTYENVRRSSRRASLRLSGSQVSQLGSNA